jgi:hypothetical protein
MKKTVERGRSYRHAKNAGKGSKARNIGPKFRENYDRIFGPKKFNGRKSKREYPDDPKDYSCIMLPKPPIDLWEMMNDIQESLFRSPPDFSKMGHKK